MEIRAQVRPNRYQDSVTLMRLAREVAALDGVAHAAAVMGTPANKALLAEAGLLTAAAEAAGPTDLVLAIAAASPAALAAAEACAERLLASAPADRAPGEAPGVAAPRTVAEGIAHLPGANLLLVSTPGPYAAAEALKGLHAGLHVFLFSDNVSLEQEVLLKQVARERGLLCMGPDCGTALLGGVALGFANVVRRGPVGVVGPSGTGIQQVTTLLHRLGSGVSHAIGSGSRDLSAAVGGATTLQALDLLAADPATRVVVVAAKPADPAVAQRVVDRCRALGKPAVVAFLGLEAVDLDWAGVTVAHTLDDAAAGAVAAAAMGLAPAATLATPGLPAAIAEAARALGPRQRYLRGLYSGGTLCAEALVLLRDAGLAVASNVHLPGRPTADAAPGGGHRCLDLGADEYTVGRPHPMIDFRARLERLHAEADDPTVAVLVLDVVLGHGAHPDPAAELAPAIAAARVHAREQGRALAVVGALCGTDDDPQDLARQAAWLEAAGMVLLPSNAAAVRAAVHLATREPAAEAVRS